MAMSRSKLDDVRVLVVDDDPSMVATLKDILEATGFAVDVAHSGTEAIEKTLNCMPDCILMDVRMPGLDGVETFRELKRTAPQCNVIFMTAFASAELVDEARNEGAVQVFAKPLDLERVIHLIEKTTSKVSVLVIGDASTSERALGDCLSASELDVRFAHCVDDAVLLFRQQPWQAVIVDMEYGARIGVDGLRVIRDLDPYAAMILLSGLEGSDPTTRQDLEGIASSYFSRPSTLDDLLERVRKASGLRR